MRDDAVDPEGVSASDAKPVPPNPYDYSGCCGGGCNPCVFDLYWDAQARYEIAVGAWQLRHARKQL